VERFFESRAAAGKDPAHGPEEFVRFDNAVQATLRA
jgi:hypothetical protein